MPKPPSPSSDRAINRGAASGADAELNELMAMLGEDAAEDDAAGIDDADLASLLEGLGASAKEREEAEVRQLLEGLPELSSDAELGAEATSATALQGEADTLEELLSRAPSLSLTNSSDAEEAFDADGLSRENIGGDDVAIETLEAPVDEYMEGTEEDSGADSGPLRRNAAAGVQVPSVMRRRAESDFISSDYVGSEYNSEAYDETDGETADETDGETTDETDGETDGETAAENEWAESRHEISPPLEELEGTEPALPEGLHTLPTPVEPVSTRMTLRELLPLDAVRAVVEVSESAPEAPVSSHPPSEPALSPLVATLESPRASAPAPERSPQRAQAFPTDPEHTLPPLRDPLASRKAIAEERVQQLLTEDIQSIQAFRMLRFFVVTGVERVTLEELQEELVEPRDLLLSVLSHLMASGLVIADGTHYALNTRARKLSLLGTAVAQWQTPRRREQLLGWLKKLPT